ncbi:sushi, von Willebrand factor type A, EGF and pentraxin domain-containing protein 1-like [Lytechinus variegatus]|uniref:sushi, von Willebrand factor type A, EGF and pentraxin domain-containing protein 1-like n=1 Tax=Lytechinus variegatus TaxID=7654 RepID=UPI001BB0F00F|nr:sushi, von Willebrand factor type A, EGF and pentraxin domain-containing protein 1-like [Lytechinus variegatus]
MTPQCNGGQSINYTDTCSYSCDVGYNLIGSESVTCQANTSLSDFLPTCEVVVCPLPEVFHPELSSVFGNCSEGSSIDFNTTCSFECSKGYDLIGSEIVGCLSNGTLSESLPSCNVVSCSIPVLPPRLSTMMSQCSGGQSINYTDICLYSCDVGYNLIGSDSVICLANTSLSDFLPTCEVVTCQLPTMFPSFLQTTSTVNNCTEGEQILYNTSCTYDCEVGYNLTGNSTVSCQENGDLSSELPKCGVLQCYVPSFSDGLISLESTCYERMYINFTDSCYFECEVGFDLIGNDTVTCGEDALLSSDLPACQVVMCPLPEVFHPELSSKFRNCSGGSSIEFDTTCTFECSEGYDLIGSESVRCQSNGTLSKSPPTCNVVTCNVPEQLTPNLSTQCNLGENVEYNATCEFFCDIGYDLLGESSLACLANGTFSSDTPTCQIVTCPLDVPPAELSLGNCSEENFIDFGTTCTLECSKGYTLNGMETVTCQSNGTLSAPFPSCNIVSCSIPALPLRLSSMTSQCNGGQSINYTQTCSFSCDTGYNLVGSSSLTCLANSSLSDSLPTCEIETCGVPQLLSPLSTSCPMGQQVAYNTSCEFSCENGYTLQGMPSLTCLASGNFSDEIPTCQIATCPLPGVFPQELSSVDCDAGSSIDFNSMCTFECSEGYDLVGSSTITCQNNGQVSPSIPTCSGKLNPYV